MCWAVPETCLAQHGHVRSHNTRAVQVDYYGAPTPLRQIANLSAPEAGMLVVQPYDKSAIPNIEKAIMASDLGLTPGNDGNLIRINVPQLTAVRFRLVANAGGVCCAQTAPKCMDPHAPRIDGRRWPSWCPSWGRTARLPSGTAADWTRVSCSWCTPEDTKEECWPHAGMCDGMPSS